MTKQPVGRVGGWAVAGALNSEGKRQGGDGTYVDGARRNGPSPSLARPSRALEGLKACARSPPTAVLDEEVSHRNDEGWKTIKKRWEHLNKLDRRSQVIWGMPLDADIDEVQRFFVSKGLSRASFRWRGAGVRRHVLAEWTTPALKREDDAATRRACELLGAKRARMRSWATRQQHRGLRGMTVQPRAPPPANEYEALRGDDDGKADSEQSPPPAPDKGERLRLRKELKKLKRHTFTMGTINCQGAIVDKIGEYEDYAKKNGFDILAIQEARLKPKTPLASKGYRVFRQDSEFEDAAHGVMFLVAEHLATAVMKEKCSVSNQLWIRITGTGGARDLFVCSAYLPQESAKTLEAEDAFGELRAAAKVYATKGDVALLGDMNAKLLSPVGEREARLIGKFGQSGDRSRNGKLLMGVMTAAGLASLTGQRPPPRKSRAAGQVGYWWTRRDSRTGTHNTLDYILVSEGLMESNTRCWVSYEDLDSDHHLMGAILPCPRVVVRKRGRKKKRRKFKTDKWIQKSSKQADVDKAANERAKYQAGLEIEFKGFDPASSSSQCGCSAACACAAVEEFVKRTEAACEGSVGSSVPNRKFSRSWFDDEVKEIVKRRRKAYEEWLLQEDEGLRQLQWGLYTKLRAEGKKAVRRKKREDWAKLMERMEEAYHKDTAQLWKLIGRFVTSGKKATVAPIRQQDGAMAKSEEQILEAWAQHQERLGTPAVRDGTDVDYMKRVHDQVQECAKLSPEIEDTDVDREFDDEEIKAGLERLHYHKAGTDDGTTNPMYKCGGDKMVLELRKLFNFLRQKETIYKGWQRSAVVNLFKEGDRADPGNYRGIALISCLGKLYLSLWARRLAQHADGSLDESQGGFRSERGTPDQGLTLYEGLLHRKTEGKTTFLCFIDFRKAFDTVWHDGLWKRLWDSGVKGKAWRVVRSLYSSMGASVKLGDKLSREVLMRQGVRQGCPLSPTLFNYFINALAKDLRESGFGAQIAHLNLDSLLYADDVVLVADSAANLQQLIERVDKFCRRWQMEINLSKSEVMVIGQRDTCAPCARLVSEGLGEAGCALCAPFECRGVRLKVVDKYKYLGIWFTSCLRWTHHLEVAVQKAKQSTRDLGRVFFNKRIPAKAKALVWLSTVRPKLEYGAEVWKANDPQAKKLESVQVQAGAKIFGLNMHTNAHAVRALLQVQPLELRRKVARLKYAGKLLTMGKERWARAFAALPAGKAVKGQGRVKQWSERIQADLQSDKVLRDGYGKLSRAAEMNHGVLPKGKDPTCQDFEYFPVKSWRKCLEWWARKQDVAAFREANNEQRSTLHVAARALGDKDERMPRFPITKQTAAGPNQVRLRLLSGTSALNATLRHYISDRSAACPHDSCDGPVEDPLHFLLHCDATKDLRQTYESSLVDLCECERRLGAGDFEGCAEFYSGLDDKGKALFILGGPVNGREPEVAVDGAAKVFVLDAYTRRSAALNDKSESPLVADLSEAKGERPVAGSIRQYFANMPAPHTAPRASLDPGLARVPGSRSRSTGARHTTHARSLAPIGIDKFFVRRDGSGLNGQQAKRSY
jgi:exonuclease III